MRQLVEEVEEVTTQRATLAEEVSRLVLATSFPLQPAPPAPPRYQRARISLDFPPDGPMLSLSGEETQTEAEQKKGVVGSNAEDTSGRFRRSQSVTNPQQERPAPAKARRSRSLHQTRPRTPLQLTPTVGTSSTPTPSTQTRYTQENRALLNTQQETPSQQVQTPPTTPTTTPTTPTPTPVPEPPEKPGRLLPPSGEWQEERDQQHQHQGRRMMGISTRHLHPHQQEQRRTRRRHRGRPRPSRCVVM